MEKLGVLKTGAGKVTFLENNIRNPGLVESSLRHPQPLKRHVFKDCALEVDLYFPIFWLGARERLSQAFFICFTNQSVKLGGVIEVAEFYASQRLVPNVVPYG